MGKAYLHLRTERLYIYRDVLAPARFTCLVVSVESDGIIAWR